MNCPKCGSQMTLLLFSSVCDRCDPPTGVEQSAKAAVEEELVFYALPNPFIVKTEGTEYFLFQTLEAAREARKTKSWTTIVAPVRIVFRQRKHIYFDPDDRTYRPYRVFSSEDHPLSLGLEVYGVWAD